MKIKDLKLGPLTYLIRIIVSSVLKQQQQSNFSTELKLCFWKASLKSRLSFFLFIFFKYFGLHHLLRGIFGPLAPQGDTFCFPAAELELQLLCNYQAAIT